jgi:hypothetical protein
LLITHIQYILLAFKKNWAKIARRERGGGVWSPLFLLLSAAPLLELEAERHPRGDVVEGQRVPVLQNIANPLPVAGDPARETGSGSRQAKKVPQQRKKRKFCVKELSGGLKAFPVDCKFFFLNVTFAGSTSGIS